MEAKQFKSKREALLFTQDGLARALGVSRHTIMRYEMGQTKIPNPTIIALNSLKGQKCKRVKLKRSYARPSRSRGYSPSVSSS